MEGAAGLQRQVGQDQRRFSSGLLAGLVFRTVLSTSRLKSCCYLVCFRCDHIGMCVMLVWFFFLVTEVCYKEV